MRSRSPISRRYLGLILYKTYADLRAESARTYVGYAWWVVEPVISMAVYYFVFDWILNRGTKNYSTFLLVGLVPWRWFATGVMHGSNSILAARPLMQQVYLPKVILPLISFLSDTFKFLVVFVLLLIFLAVVGNPVGTSYLALPFIVLVQGLVVAAFTTLAAAALPFLPDLRMVLDSVLRLMFFVSGIFHPLNVLSERGQFYLRLNPMTTIAESYRRVLLEGSWPDMGWLSVVGLMAVVLFALGAGIIHYFDYQYPRVSR